jgi:hypothetical protein
MNRFGTALVLSLIVVPLSASAATPTPHPSASLKPHGAMMRGTTKQGPKSHATPAPKHTMNKGAMMPNRGGPTPAPGH